VVGIANVASSTFFFFVCGSKYGVCHWLSFSITDRKMPEFLFSFSSTGRVSAAPAGGSRFLFWAVLEVGGARRRVGGAKPAASCDEKLEESYVCAVSAVGSASLGIHDEDGGERRQRICECVVTFLSIYKRRG